MHRLRHEQGFGLVELLIAMTVMQVALFALVAAFSSGAIALNHASHVSTAASLADSRMEMYRAMTWGAIGINTATTTDSVYQGDTSACVGGATCSNVAPSAPACPNPYFSNPLSIGSCTPSQTVTGPDHYSYRIDTYVRQPTPASNQRATKLVTVVVRDPSSSNKSLAREASTFDCSTGQDPTQAPC